MASLRLTQKSPTISCNRRALAFVRPPRDQRSALDHQADIAKVQEWFGHANIAMMRIYDHLKNSAERQPDVQSELLTVMACVSDKPRPPADLYTELAK